MASYCVCHPWYQLIQYIPGEREMGCGPTGAVLYRVAEWSVLATEDESW